MYTHRERRERRECTDAHGCARTARSARVRTDVHGCARMRTDGTDGTDAHGWHGSARTARMCTDGMDRTDVARMAVELLAILEFTNSMYKPVCERCAMNTQNRILLPAGL